MNNTHVRLEKPLLLTSAIGLCLSLYVALVGNFLAAAAIFGVTFVLLGQMLDYAIAMHSGQAHWLTALSRAATATIRPAGTVPQRG
jgi:hypothetical protein